LPGQVNGSLSPTGHLQRSTSPLLQPVQKERVWPRELVNFKRRGAGGVMAPRWKGAWLAFVHVLVVFSLPLFVFAAVPAPWRFVVAGKATNDV
jgi:hypothetical protein